MSFHDPSVGENNHAVTANPNPTGAGYADIAAREADTNFNTNLSNIDKFIRVESPLSLYWLAASGDFREITSTELDTFLELLDVIPSSYFGQAGNVLQVDSSETGVEFGQDLTITGNPTFSQVNVGDAGLIVGASTPFSDVAGTLTLQNVDAVDAVTEATIEAAIDALANLVSIQGQAVSLSGPLTVESASVINQDLTTDASPTFVNLTVSGFVDGRDISVDGAFIDLNTTHRSSDGKTHSDVVLNTAHRISDGKNHSDVVLNNAHRISDGKDHSDVVLNNTHRSSDGSDHTFLDQSVTILSTPTFLKAVIGITVTPDGTLHVHTGSSGAVSANSAANALVVEDSTNNGISILTPDASVGRVVFGSPSDNFGAFLVWSFSSSDFAVGTSKIGANFRLTSDQETTNLTLSGGVGSELATFAKDVTITGALSGLTQLTIDNIDINGNTISVINLNGDLILDAFAAGTGVVKVTDQLIIEGSTSQLLLNDTDNDKTYILKSNLGDFSIVEIGGNNVFKIRTGAAVNSLDINSTEVTIGTKLIVGESAPDTKLHVADGTAGSVTAFAGTIATFESPGDGFLSILTADANIRGILFGEPSSNVAGGIFYNDPGSPDGFQFRVNGNQTAMVIEGDKRVGIGTTNPDVTAILDLSSTTLGFLPPRMTTVQRDAISSPLAGLKIHNTTVDKPEVFTGTSWKAILTEDLANVIAQETFASTNVRFFGELALPAAQGWTDTATGIATIDLVTQTIFGEVKQVVRHNDNTTGGSTTSKIILTAQNWIDINNFGASYSGTARLDTVSGASGFFSGLQANAAENPLATGNRRYGILFNSDAGNLQLIEADNNPGNSVTMDGTGGNPAVLFDEWFKWECVVPAGLGAAEVYINGILTTFVPLFLVNGGGLGTQIIVSSGSTGGANRIAYHDNFGVTIFEEAATKTLAVVTMAADVAQVNIPEGKRDYVIILPDGNPRLIGSTLRLVVNNLFGTITLQNQTPAAPEALFNGLAEIVFTVFSKEIVVGVNTVDQGNVYIGFKAEDVDRASSIFAQLHSIIDQIPTDVNPTVITYTNHDAINGIGHSTTINTGELEILPGFGGTYSVIAQPQVGKDTGGTKVDFDMFLQVNRGAGFVDEPNSNAELTIKDSDITDVIVSAITIQLQSGDKLRMMQSVSDAAVGMGLKNTDPVVGPPTKPRTPSIIFAMHRVGG